jgi:hypothetical protein
LSVVIKHSLGNATQRDP